jgi:hypothetical protein
LTKVLESVNCSSLQDQSEKDLRRTKGAHLSHNDMPKLLVQRHDSHVPRCPPRRENREEKVPFGCSATGRGSGGGRTTGT